MDQRGVRLEKDRLYKKQKCAETLSKQESEINQQEYLNMFDNCQNGSIEEQSWQRSILIGFIRLCITTLFNVQYVMRHGL